jgi:hypothetical protein
MNDTGKQPQRLTGSTLLHHDAASNYQDRARNSRTTTATSPISLTTKRALSTPGKTMSISPMCREKSVTTIRKNDFVTNKYNAPERPPLGCPSHHIDIPTSVRDLHPSQATADEVSQQPQPFGYCHGDFASGQIYQLQLQDKSFCHSYNYYGDILAVGTATSIDFYDTSSATIQNGSTHTCTGHPYSIITFISHPAVTGNNGTINNMISAMVWIVPPTVPPTKLRTTSASSVKATALNINQYSDVTARSIHDCSYHYSTNTGTYKNSDANQQLLAVSDLSGRIYLYSINPDILESQGPTLIYCGNNSNGTQIRSLAAGYYDNGRNQTDESDHMSLLIMAGDKGGCITIITFDVSIYPPNNPLYIDTKQFRVIQQHPPQAQYIVKEAYMNEHCGSNTNHTSSSNGGILGIAMEVERGMMAICTSSGLVQVFSLPSLLSNALHNIQTVTSSNQYDQNGSLLWSSQNVTSSAIRCITFGPNDTSTLMYGGYDKTIILVDTDQWTITRELSVQGTVSCSGTKIFHFC